MPSALVIVESPAKARTISGYLGDDFIVESSIGHIRDLPKTAAEIPASYKGEPWARLGIDVDNDFKAIYVVDKDKRKHINSLKKLASSVDTVYLATDDDREGEAIAWHLLEELSPPTNVEVKRMVFHEITKAAILKALDELSRDKIDSDEETLGENHEENDKEKLSRDKIDDNLVEAQEARRMLDRLYGFEVSPVLWKKIKPKLSAGRVQSVAVRIVVDRERERMQFVAAEYWSVEATLAADNAGGNAAGNAAGGSAGTFEAAVTELDGKRIATGKDFNDKGELAKGQQKNSASLILLDETSARQLSDSLQGQQAKVSDMTVKPYSRRPYPPFITSTLQQEASNRLRLSSADTMRAAQGLYEKGLITYMRTDSTTLSDAAVKSARAIIKSRFGNDYLPSSPRTWKSKVKNAQEAHEAIRPSGSSFRTPQEVAKIADTAREAQLYELIYKRTLACQMTDAVGETASVKLAAPAGEQVATLSASGTVITHPGWQAAYADASGADSSASSAKGGGGKGSGTASGSNLPPMSKGDALGITSADANGHSTKPPARYTEATLVKRLEELGVGRPSTYATIMRTIMDRGYVSKNGSQLVPNFTAFSVVNLLATHFPDLVDYAFTARMEDDLDRIARGEQERIPWLRDFYFGDSGSEQAVGLKTLVSEHLDEIDPRKINEILLGADENGEPVYVREGRFGPYVSRGIGENAERASVPEGTVPDELTVERAVELLSTPDQKVLGAHPDTGEDISVRTGRFGPYVQLGEGEKPKRSSLFATMTPETVTLEEAVALLSLPRVVGLGAEGEEVVVQNGRYGPFVKMGKETRSLENEEQLLSITLEECQAILSQPKTRGGQSRQAKTLQEIGPHPETGDPIVLKDGRYGPYVTDGKTNASLSKSDTPEDITIDRALELIKLRQASKSQKRSAQRSPRKKTAKR